MEFHVGWVRDTNIWNPYASLKYCRDFLVKECDEFVTHIWNSKWGEFETHKYYRNFLVKGWDEFLTHIWSSKWGEFETLIYETRMPPSSTIETSWCTACYTPDTHIATNQKESLTLVAQLISLSQVISLLQLYRESVAAINRVFILYGVWLACFCRI